MTRPSTNGPRSSAAETTLFADSLVAILRVTPSTSEELAKCTGFGGTYIRSRLNALSAAGRVVVEHRTMPRGGRKNVWAVPAVAAPVKACVLRDPLVAALFGPAHSEAA